jgi:uncharacterized HhH-GPD family protein
VGAALLAYGLELDAAAAAQAGSGFSGIAEADALLASSANAFVLGVLFTQGIPAERAWAGPFLLGQRLGTLDLEYLASHPAEIRAAVQLPPMLHRFKNTLPKWICSAAERLRDEWGGDASQMWPSGASTAEVVERLGAFDGIGRKKAVMAAGILARHFGVELAERQHGQVAYDVHVRRVFLRTGLVESDSLEAIEAAAAAIHPDAPDVLDLAAWLVGREYCRPRAPRCDECRLSQSCPRLTDRQVDGVGVRRGS